MNQGSTNSDWVKLEGPLKQADIRALKAHGHIEKLSVTDSPLLTAKTTHAFTSLPSVSWLWLWCDVTRTAMRNVIRIHGLKVLDVLSITAPGRLEGFATATSLETFRGNHYLTEEDLLEVSTCKSLRQIGAQNAALSLRALMALLALPHLETLDLEATVFDDAMAKRVSASKQLRSLDIGATKLSRRGLMYICKMKQLRSLDLWATRIQEEDIELLSQLPNLEYVSIGETEGNTKFNAESLLPRLAAIRSLQRVWLDGVAISPGQKAKLESRFSTVRLT